jgi:hypothetical protein
MCDEPLVKKTVTLPESYIRRLKVFGGGNLSEGIRALVEHARTESGAFWFDVGQEGQVDII